MDQVDRDRSISVSPKTRLPSQSQIMDQRRSNSQDQWGGPLQQAYHENYRDGGHSASGTMHTPLPRAVPSGSQASSGPDARLAQNSLSHLNAPMHGDRAPSFQPAENQHSASSPDMVHNSQPIQIVDPSNVRHFEVGAERPALSVPRPISDTENVPSRASITPTEPMGTIADADGLNGHVRQLENQQAMPTQTSYDSMQGTESEMHAGIKRELGSIVDLSQPPQNKTRYNEPPIWARRSSMTTRLREQRHAKGAKQERINTRLQSRSVTPLATKSPANGDMNGTKAPAAGPDFEETNNGPLGYWERCITNVEPYNDVTRIVTDFIYSELAQRPDISVNDVGQNVSPNGQIEIEAKLGTLVDRQNNARLRLPVVSAVILDLEARKHVAFESFMTEVSSVPDSGT